MNGGWVRGEVVKETHVSLNWEFADPSFFVPNWGVVGHTLQCSKALERHHCPQPAIALEN